MNNMESAPRVFRPRIMPRDFGDILIALFIAFPCQVVPLFVLPALIAFLLTSDLGVALSILVLIYVVFLAFSVWSVRGESDGLRFKRILGNPKFLAWPDILRVREATRSQVILHGWIWPLLPAREMTPAMTARGHVRIEWKGGYCFFPPSDPKEFLRYVQARIPSTEQ